MQNLQIETKMTRAVKLKFLWTQQNSVFPCYDDIFQSIKPHISSKEMSLAKLPAPVPLFLTKRFTYWHIRVLLHYLELRIHEVASLPSVNTSGL